MDPRFIDLEERETRGREGAHAAPRAAPHAVLQGYPSLQSLTQKLPADEDIFFDDESHNAEDPRDRSSVGEEDRAPTTACCGCLAVFGGLFSKMEDIVHFIFPPGGILSSALSLASGSIGAGILGLPGATDTSGLVMAMIYLVIITFFSVYSMHILAIAAKKTGIKTFEGVAYALFPSSNHAFSYWVAFIRWFHAFGSCIGYLISVGNCFHPIFKEALSHNPGNTALQYFNSTSGNRLLIALVWLCIILPLVIPKHINSLRYPAMCAVCFMIYFVIVIVVHSCMNGLPEHRHNIVLSGTRGKVVEGDNIFLFRTGNPAVSSLGVFMFAYICQINAYEVYWDMRPEIRTTQNYTWAAFLGMMICGVLYVLVSVFGYMDFGSAKLQSNSILLMYSPLDEPQVMLGYVGVLVKLCVSYALLSMASRNAIYYVMGWQTKYRNAKKKKGAAARTSSSAEQPAQGGGSALPGARGDEAAPAEEGDDEDDLPVAAEEADVSAEPDLEDTTFVDNIPFWRHCLVVVILAVCCLICGLFIPNINIVFGFAGAISGSFLAFIFPALFHMFCGDFTIQKTGWFRFWTTYALLVTGVIGLVFGTGATIYGIASG